MIKLYVNSIAWGFTVLIQTAWTTFSGR